MRQNPTGASWLLGTRPCRGMTWGHRTQSSEQKEHEIDVFRSFPAVKVLKDPIIRRVKISERLAKIICVQNYNRVHLAETDSAN